MPGTICRERANDVKILSGVYDLEKLLDTGSGIHEAHGAVSSAGDLAQRDQRPQAGAVHRRRPGQVYLQARLFKQDGANLILERTVVGGGQFSESSN